MQKAALLLPKEQAPQAIVKVVPVLTLSRKTAKKIRCCIVCFVDPVE